MSDYSEQRGPDCPQMVLPHVYEELLARHNTRVKRVVKRVVKQVVKQVVKWYKTRGYALAALVGEG